MNYRNSDILKYGTWKIHRKLVNTLCASRDFTGILSSIGASHRAVTVQYIQNGAPSY